MDEFTLALYFTVAVWTTFYVFNLKYLFEMLLFVKKTTFYHVVNIFGLILGGYVLGSVNGIFNNSGEYSVSTTFLAMFGSSLLVLFPYTIVFFIAFLGDKNCSTCE